MKRPAPGRRGMAAAAFRKGLTALDTPRAPPPYETGVRAAAVPAADLLALGRMVETNGGSALEDVAGFDAFRARNRGLFPLAALPTVAGAGANAGSDGFALENVIGRDNLVPVPDTTALPWRSIALLSITYEDGNRATGTAWFAGERTLGTAGHNIRHPRFGKATEIMVSPAYDGSTAPFGTFRATQTWADPRWLAGDTDPVLDFGALGIDDATVGQRLGWFGVAAYDNRQLSNMLLNVSGYPTDRQPRTQHFNGGRLDDMDAAFLRYTFDTVGGMSGAPIFARFDTQRVVVGIHTSGNDRANRARRVDADIFAALQRFAALG
ncbi:serine protease [Sphingomonas sp. SUN039]|uniref:trypsin-like serine peptidase n=1 Tax=Sphingomonas sp. SUN039 TaxID=2937787 RepID=UPI0021644403|nr:hypothetical protein [Sphingomonas sp. SUN039]UVO54222.1 hypothetical protein M0209_08870 [Sphingomonas sp. SUN039]